MANTQINPTMPEGPKKSKLETFANVMGILTTLGSLAGQGMSAFSKAGAAAGAAGDAAKSADFLQEFGAPIEFAPGAAAAAAPNPMQPDIFGGLPKPENNLTFGLGKFVDPAKAGYLEKMKTAMPGFFSGYKPGNASVVGNR